eukprot:m.125357 g.125357  ORF g.125357 m.125357 type:complete len:344 (+) comp37869_c0_seq1:1520-2551(+)
MKLSIRLKDGQDVFYSGQRVSGVVEVELTKSTKAHHLLLTATGVGKSKLYNEEFEKVVQNRSYLNRNVILWKKSDTNGGVLPPQTLNFPFSFCFDDNVPASVITESNCCSIQYYLKAKLVRPWKRNFSCRKDLTVVPYIDVNEPGFLASMIGSTQKFVSLPFRRSAGSLVTLEAGVDRTGYCPGESILVTAKVENNSKAKAKGIVAELIALATVNVGGLSILESWTVCDTKGAAIPPGKTERWNAMPLHLPKTPPSLPPSWCDLISLRYYVRIHVDVRGEELVTYFPIFIGSVPLDRTAIDFRQSEPPDYVDNSDEGLPFHADSAITLDSHAPLGLTPPPGFN